MGASGYIGFRDFIPMMENQLEADMEDFLCFFLFFVFGGL